jgi:hypothetical protein
VLQLDDRTQATLTGDAVVLIGYPTEIEGILARAGSDVTQKIVRSTQDVNHIMSQLASQHLIRPTTTQGLAVGLNEFSYKFGRLQGTGKLFTGKIN